MLSIGGNMATIEIKQAHQLGGAAARSAVETVAAKLRADLNASYQWQGDRLAFECPGAKGSIDVCDDAVQVSVDLGWLLKPMRGRIEASIRQYLDEGLA